MTTKQKEPYFTCYYCDYSTNFIIEYQEHVKQEHQGQPPYPSLSYIEKNGLKSQGKYAERLPVIQDIENYY